MGTARHKSFEVDRRVRVTHDPGEPKEAVYGGALRGLMADQVRAIRDPRHERRATDSDALRALETAAEADRLAREGAGA